MTPSASTCADALSVRPGPARFEFEGFAEFAFAQLLACPLGDPGRCQHPDCQRPFATARAWQRYCCAACRLADEAEFRRIGLKAAPALLAHRLGKYATGRGAADPARRALSAAARRYLGALQTEWLRNCRTRAQQARGRWV